MSIYNNPQKYAEKTFITLEQAEVRCKHFNDLNEIVRKAKKCPKCGETTLEFEGGSYEEGYDDYIHCENDEVKAIDDDGDEYFTECDFTSDVTEEYHPLCHWYDFDEVLALASKEGIEETEHQIGCSWAEYVEESNKKLVAHK